MSETTAEIALIETPEVAAIINQSGLAHEKAQQHVAAFAPHLQLIGDLETEIAKFKGVEPDNKLAKEAKELRKKYKDNRVASEKLKDERKKSLLNETNLIQALYNLVKNTSAMKEEYLETIEKHVELMEQKRKDDQFMMRMAELKVFIDAGISVAENLIRDMDDAVFAHYKTGIEKTYNDKVEAERKAEQERVDRERKERVLIERRNELAPYRQFLEEDEVITLETSSEEYETLLNTLIERKGFYDAEQARILAENERLKKEAEEKEAALKAEREAAEAKQRLADEEARKERQRIIAEQQAFEEAARKEREAIEAKAEADRIEAQRIADEKLADERRIVAEKQKEADLLARQLADKQAAEEQAERDRIAEEERVNSLGDKAKMEQLQRELIAVCSKFVFKSKAYNDKAEQLVNYIQNL